MSKAYKEILSKPHEKLDERIKINKVYKSNCDKNKYREKYKLQYREIKRKLVILKGNKCSCCEKEFPLCCYDFHHRDPKTKDLELKDLIKMFPNEKDMYLVIEELDKCDLVCSNCHRIIHHGEY